MDPNTGRLYPDLEAARVAGVTNPVQISGRLEDIERVSTAVKAAYDKAAHDKEKKRAARKAAKLARKAQR